MKRTRENSPGAFEVGVGVVLGVGTIVAMLLGFWGLSVALGFLSGCYIMTGMERSKRG